MKAAVPALTAALLLVLVTGRPSGFAFAAGLAGVLGLALLAGFLQRGRAFRERHRGTLVLLLLLLPALVQFHAAGGRMGGDGVSYYVYVRSLVKDLDLDFTNEYEHYGLLDREDIRIPTRTGLRRSIFAVGPGLAAIPPFLVGEAAARAGHALGLATDTSGYGPLHVNAVALGGLLYGFSAVLLVHAVLRRHFAGGTALLAAVIVWWATFLHWYMVQQPIMSHASSAFGAALAVWRWERRRQGRTTLGWLALGLVFGFAMCLRWQNGVLLLLPAWDLVFRWRAEGRAGLAAAVRSGAVLTVGTLVGALPQMAAWKVIYGEWVLRYPPHGTDFLRLDHPFVLQTLFSSRHGLFAWTPVFWIAYLGFLPLLRRRPQIAWPLLGPLLLMTYVNMCSGDWWAGGSFSNRRFDSLLPVLAFGFAAGIDGLRRVLAARPEWMVAAVAAVLVTGNAATLGAVARGALPTDRPVAFPSVVGESARVMADAVGSPTTWPASWVFAWRERRPPGQYDRLVGKYLFYRQNNLGGEIRVGAPEDEALLGEGWGDTVERDGVKGRLLGGRARLFAPLDVPEDLRVALRARPEGATATVSVAVNGRPIGRVALAGADASSPGLAAPASLWRREINEVTLDAEGAPVWVAAVDFVRPGAAGTPRGARAR